MEQDIKLLVTDLDGTLIGSANEIPLYSVFKERLEQLRETDKTYWVACTGRTYRSFSEFFYPMQSMEILPDFIIVRHAYILVRTKTGYIPSIFWNLHIFHLIWRQKMYAREVLGHWRDMITGAASGVKVVEQGRDKLRLRFESEESANTSAALLRDKLSQYKHLKVFSFLREIDIYPVPFTKGLSVSELARHLNIYSGNVLAIGNGHNDISMFDSDVAGLVGCPSNSEAEVMSVIHERGGHIASKRALGGVLETIDSYKNDTVNSTLPEWWIAPPKRLNNRRDHHSARHNKSAKQLQTKSFFIMSCVIYVTLVIFAHFEIIPFADIILKPFTLLAKGMDYIFSAMYK